MCVCFVCVCFILLLIWEFAAPARTDNIWITFGAVRDSGIMICTIFEASTEPATCSLKFASPVMCVAHNELYFV